MKPPASLANAHAIGHYWIWTLLAASPGSGTEILYLLAQNQQKIYPYFCADSIFVDFGEMKGEIKMQIFRTTVQ